MTDWHSYLAGFFDGEGSITIARQRTNGCSDYHFIVVSVGQRAEYRAILDRIATDFGGRVALRRSASRVSHAWAEYATWQLSEKAALRRFLEAVQPHCIVKAPQVALALEFLATFVGGRSFRDDLGRVHGRVLTADEIERRERIRLAMRALNAKGPPKVAPSQLPPLDLQHRRRTEAAAAGDASTVSRGAHRYNARLTDDDVRAIRARFAAGGVTKSALARQYGVTGGLIGGIIQRTRWAHVADTPVEAQASVQHALFDQEQPVE